MRIISFVLLLTVIGTLNVHAHNNVFDSIVSKVRSRIGHHSLPPLPSTPHHIRIPSPGIPERNLHHDAYQPWTTNPNMPSIVLPTQSVPHDVNREENRKLIGGDEVEEGKKHHCKECIRWTAHHILKETVNQTLTFCAHTTCPKLKAKCDWIAKNLNFSVGYIAQKIRPIGSGRLFCEGAGRCPVHYNSSSSMMMHEEVDGVYDDSDDESMNHVDDAEMYGEMEGQTTGIASIVQGEETNTITENKNNDNNNNNNNNNRDESDDDNILGKADLMEGVVDSEIQNAQFIPNMFEADFDDTPAGLICSGCVQLGASHVVSGIWARTAAFCKNPVNPKWAARCEFTFAHKEFSTGYIYSKFRPSKVSYGYCMGKGLCPHPKSTTTFMNQPIPMFDLNF